MKKITILLVLVLLCAAVIFPAAAGAQDSENSTEKTIEDVKEGIQIAKAVSGDYEYTGYYEGFATITGYLGTDTDIVIPDTIEGYTVTKLNGSSFYDKGLTSVVIPDSVVYIGTEAFADNSLTSVVIPENAERIKMSAFANNSLTSITYPTTLIEMGNSAFNNNAITTVNGEPSNGIIFGQNSYVSPAQTDYTVIASYGGSADDIDFIPSTVKIIANYAFSNCGLNSVTIPTSVTKIQYAFGNNNFSYFTLPDLEGVWMCDYGTEHAGGDSVSVNYSYELYQEYEYIDIGNNECAISSYNGEDTAITIPETIDGLSVAWIQPNVFENLGLTSVTFPSGLKVMEGYAFRDNSLTSVTLPDGMESIGQSAFEGNDIQTLVIPSTVTSIGRAAFNGNAVTTLNGQASDGMIYKRNVYTGDEETTTVVSYAGDDRTVAIPEGVTVLEDSSFARCNLTLVTLPQTIQIVSHRAFMSNLLQDIHLQSGMTFIGRDAFYDNEFNFFNLPNTDDQWWGTDNIQYSGGDLVSVDYFYDKDLIYGYVAHGDGTCTVNAYNSGDSFPEIPNTIDNRTVIGIAANTFEDSNIITVTLPRYLKTIGEMAFYDNRIVSIEIPDTVIEIGNAAFNKNEITTVNEKSSDGIIYARKADGSENKEIIVSYGGVETDIDFIPQGVTRIESKAFMGVGADSVVIPFGVNLIGDDAFAENNFTNITLPEGSGEWGGSEGTHYGGDSAAADGYYYLVSRPADADIDDNGIVDLLDIAAVAQHYQEYNIGFDQTGNGLVNLYDLVVVAGNVETY